MIQQAIQRMIQQISQQQAQQRWTYQEECTDEREMATKRCALLSQHFQRYSQHSTHNVAPMVALSAELLHVGAHAETGVSEAQ